MEWPERLQEMFRMSPPEEVEGDAYEIFKAKWEEVQDATGRIDTTMKCGDMLYYLAKLVRGQSRYIWAETLCDIWITRMEEFAGVPIGIIAKAACAKFSDPDREREVVMRVLGYCYCKIHEFDYTGCAECPLCALERMGYEINFKNGIVGFCE